MSRLDSRGSSTLLTVLAVALIGGFLYWLYHRSQQLDTSVEPVMEETASAEASLKLGQVATAPESAIGERVFFDSASVSVGLGRGVFLLGVQDTLRFPVLLNPTLIQQGTQLYGGDVVNVGGRIYTLNDSIQQVWVESGAVNAAAASEIPEVASFLLADTLVVR